MKIALINDTHAGARGDDPRFNEYFFKFWEGTFFPYLEENNITQICHLGDVVDRRKFISFVTLNSWRKRFFDVIKAKGIQMDVIVGNHDVTYKNTNEINSIDLLLREYPNIHVIQEPKKMMFENREFTFIPWLCPDNYDASLKAISEPG